MNKVRLCGFIFLLGNVFSVLFAGPRVITLEGDEIEGNITGINNQGVVSIKDTEFTLDGIRSIVASGDSNQIDESEGPRSVEAVRALAKFRGSQAGFSYGEAFYLIRQTY